MPAQLGQLNWLVSTTLSASSYKILLDLSPQLCLKHIQAYQPPQHFMCSLSVLVHPRFSPKALLSFVIALPYCFTSCIMSIDIRKYFLLYFLL